MTASWPTIRATPLLEAALTQLNSTQVNNSSGDRGSSNMRADMRVGEPFD
jgi:hypothetical protein